MSVYFEMAYCSLFVVRFRLSLLKLHVTRRFFVTFIPVAALYSNHSSCHCHPTMFGRCLASAADNRSNRTTSISFVACSLLLGAVFFPALGLMFYYRRERHKFLNKYEDQNVYQTPFVDSKTRTLVQHNGYWFPVVMFPNLQRFEQIRHFALNNDDIVIASFPKSGNIAYCVIVGLRS